MPVRDRLAERGQAVGIFQFRHDRGYLRRRRGKLVGRHGKLVYRARGGIKRIDMQYAAVPMLQHMREQAFIGQRVIASPGGRLCLWYKAENGGGGPGVLPDLL